MIRVAQILGKMNGGGAEQMVMNYYNAIDRENIQFDFFIFKGSRHVPVEEIKAMGGRIYVLPTLKRPFRYMKVLKKLLSESGYDIVHCHLSTLSGLALRAAQKAGVRVRILHNHSTSGGMRELARNIAKSLLKPFAKRYATEYLACSELAARWMYGNVPVCELTESAPPVKVARIMRNAVDTDKFRYDVKKRSELRKELNIPASMTVFGHIGRFCPQKNQSFVIDIFKEILLQHKNSVLIMAGEGGDKELIQAQVIAAGISGKVIFTGQRNDADRLYSAFDCFLLPSNYEGLPVVGVEAQCAGLYCLFSDKITKEAKITDSVQYLSLKTSAADWACAAVCCSKLRNQNGAAQVSNAGYDIKAAAKDLEKYYLSL
ncbi:MAG: glycosyltransferase family 1 protein [Oscillospiraceae bacterium]|nr:glycosyltransferase family 1 protein [Oscillospiraceae bacterium]